MDESPGMTITKPLRGCGRALRVGMLAAALPLLAACSAPAPPAPPPAPEAGSDAERVVAEVNGVPIPASRLEALVDAERIRRGSAGTPASADDERQLRAESLNLLIRAELVYQAAVARGITIPDEEIEAQLEVVRSQFPSEAEFQAHLRESGTTTDDLRREARRRLMMQAYVASVTANVVPDPARARQLYQERVDRLPDEERVRVAQILVRLRPGDSEETRRTARAKIEEAHRRAVAGEDFAALAREYSESPLAASGGDMGFIPRGRMLPAFEDIVFATPVGAITPVFETPHGLNVVKVLERQDSRKPSYGEVEGGLLLVLAREQRDEALRAHIDELERRADVRRLVP